MMKKAPRGSPNLLLKAERELRGWSQKYVADQIGADNYYLSRWEHGTAAPSPYYHRKLCLLFDKNARELGLLREKAEERPETTEEQPEVAPGPDRQIHDPAIPLPFAGGYRLVGRDDILRQLKQRLFDSGNVVLTR
jgi:transcriptional regulator with XRE-family HTH domain